MIEQSLLVRSLRGRQHTTSGHLSKHGLSDFRSAIVDVGFPPGMGINASPDKEREMQKSVVG